MTFPYCHAWHNAAIAFYDMISLDHTNLNVLHTLQTSVIVLVMLFCYLSVRDIINRYQHPPVNSIKPGDPSKQRPFLSISPVPSSVPAQNNYKMNIFGWIIRYLEIKMYIPWIWNYTTLYHIALFPGGIWTSLPLQKNWLHNLFHLRLMTHRQKLWAKIVTDSQQISRGEKTYGELHEIFACLEKKRKSSKHGKHKIYIF